MVLTLIRVDIYLFLPFSENLGFFFGLVLPEGRSSLNVYSWLLDMKRERMRENER